MATTFPFLTTYDPPGSSEGTLDPLGLYQIADQLAVQLVPAVRERMLRIRYLTAMVVGALVTEGLDDDPRERDASPYLVWEWLIAEAFVRQMAGDPSIWGAHGIMVARRAVEQRGYLDASSYLKTPRIFGFHGVYKRLAIHLGLVDVHGRSGPNAAGLVDAWASDPEPGGVAASMALMPRWKAAVRRCLDKPPRTKPGFDNRAWGDLAKAFAPGGAGAAEKKYLRDLLLGSESGGLGAFSTIWRLQDQLDEEDYLEERLHDALEAKQPAYAPLLVAIRAYETFARSLQDAFDVLRAQATVMDVQGFVIAGIASDPEFRLSVKDLHLRFEAAHRALGQVSISSVSLPNLFAERFAAFAHLMDEGTCAQAMCSLHETVQKGKSAAGKRPWFDRVGPDRIFIRHGYQIKRPEIQPGRYVHPYRSVPIRRFYRDLQ